MPYIQIACFYSFVTDDGIDTIGIDVLCSLLKTNTSLTQLEIHSLSCEQSNESECFHHLFGTDNRIEMEGVKALRRMLERNTTMTTLLLDSLN